MSKKRRSTSRKPSAASPGSKRILGLLTAIVVALFGGYYLFNQSDPLGIFTQIGSPPPTSGAPPAALAAETPSDTWWAVHFTDPHTFGSPDQLAGSIEAKLIQNINQAQRSIHIAAFEFNLTPVAEALIAAHTRGVEVEWVTDDEHGLGADSEAGHGQFALLKKAGIEVKDDGRSALMHNKFWIFDDQMVWTGATNITVNGIFANNNNVIVIYSPAVAQIYEREFDEMWGGQFGPTSPSTVDQQTATVNGVSVQVLFAPEDQVISRLAPLIESAQKSIRFMTFSFTHDDLGQAVLARAQAGVDVRGIFETRGSETKESEMRALYCANTPVRQDTNPTAFHHKVFVVDDALVITGSFNFSANADTSNDENVIIITEAGLAAAYLKEFEQRWAESVEPPVGDMHCN